MARKAAEWAQLEAEFRGLEEPTCRFHASGHSPDFGTSDRRIWIVGSDWIGHLDQAKLDRYGALMELTVRRVWMVADSPSLEMRELDPIVASPVLAWWLDVLENASWHRKQFTATRQGENLESEIIPRFDDIWKASIELCELRKHESMVEEARSKPNGIASIKEIEAEFEAEDSKQSRAAQFKKANREWIDQGHTRLTNLDLAGLCGWTATSNVRSWKAFNLHGESAREISRVLVEVASGQRKHSRK